MKKEGRLARAEKRRGGFEKGKGRSWVSLPVKQSPEGVPRRNEVAVHLYTKGKGTDWPPHAHKTPRRRGLITTEKKRINELLVPRLTIVKGR